MNTTMLRRMAGAMCGLGVVLATVAPAAFPAVSLAQDKSTPAASTKDVITLKSGKLVEGTIVEETATTIKMKVLIGGIAAEMPYDKADILSVARGTGGVKAEPPKADGKPSDIKASSKVEPGATAADAKKVYVVELTGWFGEDISETPMRNAVHDAKKLGADYIIFVLDNDWSLKRFGRDDDIKDDVGQFDQLFRAEAMETTFTEEIAHEWPADHQPTVVFWVKKAMGGACFLPFNSKIIYFASEGKMGGIGHLNKIFGSTGDKVVQEKQFALRLKHAEGRAIQGGYEPRIIPAMCRDEYVLSYKMEGGKAVFLERMPEAPGEILLTDDGKDSNEDTEEQLGRGEGNDCLTLTAKVAYDLGVSKGTVDTMDDLLFQLGLARTNVMVKGQSAQIMKGWRDGLEQARRQLPKLWHQFEEVVPKPPAGHQERTQARGKKKSIIEQMQDIEKRYQEALNPNQLRPGVPNWNQLEEIKKRLELEQLGDKPDKK